MKFLIEFGPAYRTYKQIDSLFVDVTQLRWNDGLTAEEGRGVEVSVGRAWRLGWLLLEGTSRRIIYIGPLRIVIDGWAERYILRGVTYVNDEPLHGAES